MVHVLTAKIKDIFRKLRTFWQLLQQFRQLTEPGNFDRNAIALISVESERLPSFTPSSWSENVTTTRDQMLELLSLMKDLQSAGRWLGRWHCQRVLPHVAVIPGERPAIKCLFLPIETLTSTGKYPPVRGALSRVWPRKPAGSVSWKSNRVPSIKYIKGKILTFNMRRHWLSSLRSPGTVAHHVRLTLPGEIFKILQNRNMTNPQLATTIRDLSPQTPGLWCTWWSPDEKRSGGIPFLYWPSLASDLGLYRRIWEQN